MKEHITSRREKVLMNVMTKEQRIVCPACERPLLRGDYRSSKKYLRGYILPCRDCLVKRSTEHKRKAREKEKEEKQVRMSQAEWLALVDQQLETLQQWRP